MRGFDRRDSGGTIELEITIELEEMAAHSFARELETYAHNVGEAFVRLFGHVTDVRALDNAPGIVCQCAQRAEERGDEAPYVYLRQCAWCGHSWNAQKCPHGLDQKPCPNCKVTPKRPELVIVANAKAVNER